MMAILLGRKRGTLSEEKYHELIREVSLVPDKIEKYFKAMV